MCALAGAAGIFNALVAPGYTGIGYTTSAAAKPIRDTLFYSNAGTWAITKSGVGTATGTPRTGTWASGTLAPGGYEYRIASVSQGFSGTGTLTPTAATTWAPINSTSVAICLTDVDGLSGAGNAYGIWTIEVRAIGDSYVQTSTCDLDSSATG
jgi:hypothetical protein